MTYTFRPILSVLTLLGLVILIGLGSWQWNKVLPKTQLITSMKAGLAQRAEPLDLLLAETERVLDYRRVFIEGRFIADSFLRLVAPDKSGKAGYHLYGLMETRSGQSLIVSPGFIPFEVNELPLPEKLFQRYQGVLVPEGKPGMVTPANNIQENRWYTADVAAMAEQLGLDLRKASFLAGYRLLLDEPSKGTRDGADVTGGQVRLDIKNDHLEYAITWWGLACALIFVYCAFTFKRDK